MRLRTLLLLGLSACGPIIPAPVERPAVITVVYDPSTGNLPTPNDLALDATGVVAISPNLLLSDAENALKATFNGRRGFSAASSARAQFSAHVSAASISSTSVLAFDLGANGAGPVQAAPVARTFADCDDSVTMTAPAGLLPGHRYLFAVRGGESGVQGANGEKVVPAPAFYFLRAGKDLREHADALPGATRSEKRAAAERLEAVRQKLEPYFAVLETQGVPRAQVAALWTFTVHEDGEALQDPGSKKVPMPNDLLRDATTGLVTLPADAADSPTQAELKHAFNQLDGFSTTAGLAIEFSAPLDRASVTEASVRLVKADDATLVADVVRTVSQDGKKLVLQPSTPLLPATRYVVLLAGLEDTQGALVAPTPLSSVLSLGLPLVDADGASTVSSFCAASAARLEPLRAAISGAVEATRTPRTQLNGAWTFTTQDLLARTQALWRTPWEQALPLTLTQVAREEPLLPPYELVTGKLTTFDRLDPVTRAFRANGTGAAREIDFILTLPKTANSGDTVKVVVFGHGLNTERRLSLLLADKLARAGYATLAIDFPYHGERTACLMSSHCANGGVCATDGSCLKNGLPSDFARLPIPGVPGPGTPTATGAAFIDVENLPGTRDHFRQAVIDFSALTRVIRLADWRAATGGIALDGNDIRYAGISLGGITGGLLSGIDPSFKTMLLNVGGAGLVDLMRESATFSGTLRQGLADKGIVEGTPAYDSFLNAAKWAFDEIDPINLAPYARRRPLVYRDPVTMMPSTAPVKALRLHMAIGDTVVPNTSTRRLLAATGVSEQNEFRSFIGSHGFLADPVEPACYVGQDDLVDFMENH